MDRAVVEIGVEIIWETPKAIRVSDGVDTMWLPKACVLDRREVNGGCILTLREQFAREKGFI